MEKTAAALIYCRTIRLPCSPQNHAPEMHYEDPKSNSSTGDRQGCGIAGTSDRTARFWLEWRGYNEFLSGCCHGP